MVLKTVVYIQATSVPARENSKEEREGKTEKKKLTLVSLRSANFCSSTSVSSRSCNVTSGTVEVTLSPEAAVSMVSVVRTSACAHPCLTSASITQPRFLSISLNVIWSIFITGVCVCVCVCVGGGGACVRACMCVYVCVLLLERERQTDRDRQTDRQRETDRQGETERDIDRERERVSSVFRMFYCKRPPDP